MDENPYQPPQALPEPAPQREGTAGRRAVLLSCAQVLTGVVLGAGLWAASYPEEAWDANVAFSPCLLIAGFVASFFRPAGHYFGVLGIYVGQVAFVYFALNDEHWPLSLALVAMGVFGLLPAIIGSLLGAVLGYALRRRRSKRHRQGDLSPPAAGRIP